MSITYPDPQFEMHETPEPPPRTGMRAVLGERGLAEPPRHRLTSIVISVGAHLVVAYAVLYLTLAAPKREEVKAITVSIAASQSVRETPAPPVPEMKLTPDVVQPPVLQINSAAPPSPTALDAAPPSPPVQAAPKSDAKAVQDSPVTPPGFDAAYLNNPAPVYPNMSRRLREQGVVQLRVHVSAAGQPLEVLLFKSSGYDRLDASALAAVQKWKFEPAKRNGNAIEAWVLVPIDFSLTRK